MEWLIKLDADLLRQVVIQIATFLVFFVIVKVFFADKIKEILAQRQDAIEHDLTEAAKANEDAKKLEAQYTEVMKGAMDEKTDILRSANEDGKKMKERI